MLTYGSGNSPLLYCTAQPRALFWRIIFRVYVMYIYNIGSVELLV